MSGFAASKASITGWKTSSFCADRKFTVVWAAAGMPADSPTDRQSARVAPVASGIAMDMGSPPRETFYLLIDEPLPKARDGSNLGAVFRLCQDGVDKCHNTLTIVGWCEDGIFEVR